MKKKKKEENVSNKKSTVFVNCLFCIFSATFQHVFVSKKRKSDFLGEIFHQVFNHY